MPVNNRIFYAVQQISLIPDGITSATASTNTAYKVFGLQSLGLNTNFNLDPIFEIGQLAVYELSETTPNVEIQVSKVLDGRPLLWHLSTPTATSGTLVGRSAIKVTGLLSIFPDTQNSASGAPIAECEMSGLFASNLSYDFPVEGPFTESLTLTGQNKQWRTSSLVGSGLYPGNNDAPAAASGVQRRQDILFGSGTGFTVLPPSVPGVSGVNAVSGYHVITSGNGPHIQSAKISASFQRSELLELGRKTAYFRSIPFPVQIATSVDVYCLGGDRVNALESTDSNVTDECIRIKTNDGTVIDCGNRNRLQSVSYGGANAGQNGGNAICTYNYLNYSSDLACYNSGSDPAGLVSPF